MKFATDPYEPCPCGSGKKFKFCCMKKAGSGKFPIGTLAVAGVITKEGAEAILEKFVGTHVKSDAKVAEKVKAFFLKHSVKNVVVSDGNLGCPHEEGLDFPRGGDCPFCPWWAGKQGSARRD